MAKRPELIVTTGELAGRRWSVPDGGLRLGRSSSNDIHLLDEELSRNHCLFEPVGEGGIRVIDLASANGTFVNGTSIGSEARVLRPGDTVEVGSSRLRVVAEGETPPPESHQEPAPKPPAPAAPVPGERVDLGLGKPAANPPPAAPKPSGAPNRNGIMNLVWAGVAVVLVGAIVVMLTSDKLFRSSGGDGDGNSAAAGIVVPTALAYERIDATPEKILRYAVRLNGDELTLSFDVRTVNGADGQTLEKTGKISDTTRRQLERLFDSPDWKGAESVPGSSAETINRLRSWRLRLVRKGTVKEVCIANAPLPPPFKNICTELETLVMNDLRVRLNLRSAEESLAASLKDEALGDELFAKREVRDGNLWEAIRSYRNARVSLEGVTGRFEDANRIQSKIEAAEAELAAEYDEIHGRAERALKIGDWEAARMAYREIRALIPDEEDSRGAEAVANLKDIEGRLEDARKAKRK